MRRTRINTEWRPEIDQVLLRLAGTNAKFSVIAIRLNAMFGTTFTKNAVIGHFHRTFGAKTSRRTRSAEEIAEARRNPKPAPAAKPAAPKIAWRPPVLVHPVPEPVQPSREIARPVSISRPAPVQVDMGPVGPVTLLKRTERQCCWPIGDRAPYLFCGAPKRQPRSEWDTSFRSYCDQHFQKLIVKPRRGVHSQEAAG
jgi:hypothetical protein